MEYKGLVQLNPTFENTRQDSSTFFACRGFQAGKGNKGYSVPGILENETKGVMQAIEFSTSGLYTNNNIFNLIMAVISTDNYIIAFTSQDNFSIAGRLDNLVEWRGCWIAKGTTNQIYIGYTPNPANNNNQGIVAPFNTFNIVYQLRKGWRPSHVN